MTVITKKNFKKPTQAQLKEAYKPWPIENKQTKKPTKKK